MGTVLLTELFSYEILFIDYTVVILCPMGISERMWYLSTKFFIIIINVTSRYCSVNSNGVFISLNISADPDT